MAFSRAMRKGDLVLVRFLCLVLQTPNRSRCFHEMLSEEVTMVRACW
jgi:hypothetical protein